MKGILLAGGSGTRLYPLTLVTSKQLLPVYNKPLIYYPLCTLMLAGIRELLVISTREDTPRISRLLGDGSALGLSLRYAVQERPEGIPQAFTIGRDFIGQDSCALILGDNILYGNGLEERLALAMKAAQQGRATVFGHYVEDPTRFGVMELGEACSATKRDYHVVSLEEKPSMPRSNYAVVGLYFYPPGVSELAAALSPGPRGETEITSLNRMYLEQKKLRAQLLGRGFAWIDAGTVESLRLAGNLICMLEQVQGMSICAPEEIAYRKGWISAARLAEQAARCGASPYGAYLRAVLDNRIVR